jgi:hypothetical protein
MKKVSFDGLVVSITIIVIQMPEPK